MSKLSTLLLFCLMMFSAEAHGHETTAECETALLEFEYLQGNTTEEFPVAAFGILPLGPAAPNKRPIVELARALPEFFFWHEEKTWKFMTRGYREKTAARFLKLYQCYFDSAATVVKIRGLHNGRLRPLARFSKSRGLEDFSRLSPRPSIFPTP